LQGDLPIAVNVVAALQSSKLLSTTLLVALHLRYQQTPSQREAEFQCTTLSVSITDLCCLNSTVTLSIYKWITKVVGRALPPPVSRNSVSVSPLISSTAMILCRISRPSRLPKLPTALCDLPNFETTPCVSLDNGTF